MFSFFGISNKTVVGLGYGDDACAWIKHCEGILWQFL